MLLIVKQQENITANLPEYERKIMAAHTSQGRSKPKPKQSKDKKKAKK